MAKYRAPTPETIREHWEGLFRAANHENDLHLAIMATSYIDYTLAALLQAYFIQSSQVDRLLDPNGGPLGSFMAKATIAYCMGLISKSDKGNLDIISQIRNKFAHKIEEMSFAQPEIKELCEKLSSSILEIESNTGPFSIDGTEKIMSSRNKFALVALTFCVQRHVVDQSVVRCRPLNETDLT